MLGEQAQAKHLTYLGDARIGSESNIGARTITCNYDGMRKNPTTIGRRVFVGGDTALVAPVRVGDGAYIGAGLTGPRRYRANSRSNAGHRKLVMTV